jgi:ATP/maltotriose-dependent transcriptional regulator MalT/DNA-binding SARP family transcriptional activator
MRPPPVRLAKLTRPDTSALVPRQRLFTRLDRAVSAGFAWISGSAGAGKTSLVASWLDQRRHAALWYRIDAADRDPATLFHYLALAAGTPRDLPHFTPEYLAGLRDFSRRFFRALFAHLPAPILVLDNCHEASIGSALEDIVAVALEEMPLGGALLGISRTDPGPALAHRAADHRFVHIDDDALRLDDAEARAIASMSGHDPLHVDALLTHTRGWTAGLILMLRAGRHPGGHDAPKGSQQSLFDYFTALILAHAGARLQDFLLRTSVLTSIAPSLAAELAGEAEAGRLLADLHARHFFTERRSQPGEEPVYEYHPLFREYLLERARRELGAAAFGAHCRTAAARLAQAGRAERAVDLHIMGQDWPGLIAAVRELAPELMRQGRWQTLNAWLDALPPAVVEGESWALYWRGSCRSLVNPAQAKLDFAAAYARFCEAHDPIGSLLACAGALEAGYLDLGDQTPSRIWIDELQRLLAATPALPIELELRIIQAMMGAWMAMPQHPMLPRWAARAAELLRSLPDTSGSAALIAFTGAFAMWRGDLAFARAVVESVQIEQRIIESAPMVAIMVCVVNCGVAWQSAEHERGYALVAQARRIADASGIHILDGFIASQGLYVATSAGDRERAQEELARLRALLVARRRLEVCQTGVLGANVALLEGRGGEALRIIERELHEAASLGAPFIVATIQIQYAELLVLEGREGEAHAPLDAALDFARAMPSAILHFQVAMTRAWACLRGGDRAGAHSGVAEGLPIGREHGYMNIHPMWIPDMARELVALALAAGIEVDYVRRFIRHRRLAPASADVAAWPWPIRVVTLGRFEILRDDEPMHVSGKVPQRVLDLLKAIVAQGPQGADADELAALLWPDAEGDAGRHALRVTVHRLRRLLGFDHAICVADGRILLDPGWCRVDAFVFERMADSDQTSEAHAARLLALYGGAFLAPSDRAWMLPARERLRSKFLRALEACALASMAAERLDEAADLYRRAIESDPLAESLYRSLMRCRARQGRVAEGLDTYRRCRDMLSIVLGVKPSAPTEAVRQDLIALQSSKEATAQKEAGDPLTGVTGRRKPKQRVG